MTKKLIAAFFLALYAGSAIAQDYCFPSSNPPYGKSPSEVKQYITIIWDDNGYSGKKYTQYEDTPGGDYQTGSSWVGGSLYEGGQELKKDNDLNIEEGDMGMSWAAKTLAGIQVPKYGPFNPDAAQYTTGDTVIYNDTIWAALKWMGKTDAYWTPQIVDFPDSLPDWQKTQNWAVVSPVDHSLTVSNPDGSPIHFTFNVISGLFVPTWPTNWQARESKLGYWTNQGAVDYPDGYASSNYHSKLAIAWGREMQILQSEGGTEFQANYILESFKEARDVGHEIGNHTIDHMESNSPLAAPSDAGPFPSSGGKQMAFFANNPSQTGFDRWGGEGFDYSKLDTMPWGEVVDEAVSFGQKDGASAQYMGWKVKAGKYISKAAWKGAVELSEEQLDEYLGISVANGNCHAFRAPRLEVSSGLYFGLAELGYQYDCGMEEGYESNVDGTNFLWPFTLDNGNPNAAYQRSIGESPSVDSMPAGLWSIPSNVFICHPDYRQQTYNSHKSINDAAPDGHEIESFESWVSSGAKITGYDFNMYILWGMTADAWLETMKYNTQLRLDGNKAPIHYGAHTDYYTPIYDNATLLAEFNRPSYGQVIDSQWNDWVDRVETMEQYVDWATTNGCYFVSGHELIEEIKTWKSNEKFGTAAPQTAAAWSFFKNSTLASSASQESFTGNITDASVTVAAASGDEYPDAGFAFYGTAGDFDSLGHIEMTYKTTAPLVLRLSMANDQPWEVTLGNLKKEVQSGKIPLTAFHRNQYDTISTKGYIDPKDINGFEIKLLTSGEAEESHTVSIKDFTVYRGGSQVAIASNFIPIKQNLKIQAMSKNNLKFSLAQPDRFTVKILSANGRIVKEFKNRDFRKGLNTLDLKNLSNGMYMIKINNKNQKAIFKSMIM